MEYPAFVYRKAADYREDQSAFDTLSVSDKESHSAALKNGWSSDVISALTTNNQSVAIADDVVAVVSDDLPPTRAELEAKATELGLKFDGRTSNRKLSILIAESLGK